MQSLMVFTNAWMAVEKSSRTQGQEALLETFKSQFNLFQKISNQNAEKSQDLHRWNVIGKIV